MQKKYDYLIIGSGLAGAVFAHEAKAHGFECLVLDKRNHTGGNVYCENINGINVHMFGPHIFHTDSENIWNYVNSLVSFVPFINAPLATINGKIYNLPFNMNTFYQLWGVKTPNEAVAIISDQRKKYETSYKDNLEEHALSLCGEDIYNLLIKGYTEKQWGCKCSELPSSIIKRLPLRFTFDNSYFTDIYQGIPVNGYNSLIDKLLEGSDVLLGVDYNKQRKEFEGIASHVVYTGCIDEYYDFQFGKLEYRSLNFRHSILRDVDNFQGNAVINYTDSKIPYTRIVEHKYFEKKQVHGTVITYEYPTKYTGYNEPFYPINDTKNTILFKRYKELAEKSNTIFIGRLAEYRYYDMDDVIERVLNYWEHQETKKIEQWKKE